MKSEVYNQITNLLEKSQKILVLTHARADCDGLGSALSTSLVLQSLGKDVTVATNDPTPENLLFLPSINTVQNTVADSNKFVISVDASKVTLEKIECDEEGDKVKIVLTPTAGTLTQSDVTFPSGDSNYDLIIVLDTGNLEHLGPIYDQNVELFYETPVINIDHHASNTEFGQVNLVDVTASSATEILFEFLLWLEKKMDKKLITEDVATLLLGGIITDTGSFQHANTSPRALDSSAQLLDLGARQQEIIKHIFKTKKLSTLKLWGIILSKVQVDPVHRMVWSTISKDDLQESSAHPSETEGIIDDLLTNAPGAEIIFLIKQSPDLVSVSMRSTNNQADVGKFSADNGGGGHIRAAGFKIRDDRGFEEIVNDIVGRVRAYQVERLNLGGGPVVDREQGSVDQVAEKDPRDRRKQIHATGGSRSTRPEEADPRDLSGENKVTYLDFKAPPEESSKLKTSNSNSKPQTQNPKLKKDKPDIKPV